MMSTLIRIVALSMFAAALFTNAPNIYAQSEPPEMTGPNLDPGLHLYSQANLTLGNIFFGAQEQALVLMAGFSGRIQKTYSNLLVFEVSGIAAETLFFNPGNQGKWNPHDEYEGRYYRLQIGAAYVVNSMLDELFTLDKDTILSIRLGIGGHYYAMQEDEVRAAEQTRNMEGSNDILPMGSTGVGYVRIFHDLFVISVEAELIMAAERSWSVSCGVGIML